jgi:type IV secretion system protein VirB1
MDASDFASLAATCAPAVHLQTAAALVHVESAFNPWAIGVVGGSLRRQPRSRTEALATARALRAAGWDFSVGLGQINSRNFTRLGLTLESAFEPCMNLTAMQAVLSDCFKRANAIGAASKQQALRTALSCYYSGDFVTGIKHGYVIRVVAAAAAGRHRAPLPSHVPATIPKETP